MKNILITGAAGFIGHQLWKKLKNKYKVDYDLIISAGTGNSIYFQGQVTFLDIDGDANSVIGSDGDSNETLQINVPGHYDITIVGVSATIWRISGFVASDTAPAFAD